MCNILARLAFNIFCYLRDEIEGKQGSTFHWRQGTASPSEAFAFVGSNRLLSPNNATGVSLSSDIDYKLVFQPSVIGMKSESGQEMDLSGKKLDKFVKGLNHK